MLLLPSSDNLCRITDSTFNLNRIPDNVVSFSPEISPAIYSDRRTFLKVLGALALTSFSPLSSAQSIDPITYSANPDQIPEDDPITLERELKLGEIPADFWYRPRELWLHRSSTKETIKVVYWKNDRLDEQAYWQICSILRDTRQNKMTYIDPVLLDIMRGILGYYQAWKWNYPLVINSGFRTLKTNNSLLSEGAAKNSMHLYGKAVDLYMPGIPVRDVFNLAKYFQMGGVGFYPSKMFVHIDRGRVREWRGK